MAQPQMIHVGDTLPDATLVEKHEEVKIRDVFKGKTGVLLGMPGAFTPGCTKTHLPGYIEHADELRAAGAQEIAVVCVNDPWVMAAWAKDMDTEAKGIRMLADPRCEFAQGIGCTQDDTAKLGNIRSRRYSMIVDDNVVRFLNVEKPGPTELSVSLYENSLSQLKSMKQG